MTRMHGFWNQTYPGYVYVPSDYRWTPAGYMHVPGYWDADAGSPRVALCSRRGRFHVWLGHVSSTARVMP